MIQLVPLIPWCRKRCVSYRRNEDLFQIFVPVEKKEWGSTGAPALAALQPPPAAQRQSRGYFKGVESREGPIRLLTWKRCVSGFGEVEVPK